MATGTPVEDFIARIGHRGSDLIWASGNEISNRLGHHQQECIAVCLQLGYAVTPIELFPQIAAPFTSPQGACVSVTMVPHRVLFGPDETSNWLRFANHLKNSRGVIDGFSTNACCGHTVAYDHDRIYDPQGVEYDYSRDDCEKRGFWTRCLWRVDPLRT